MIFTIIAQIEDENTRDAMTALYKRYERMVFHTVKKWIDDPDERKDVTQEVWCRLVQKAERVTALNGVARGGYVRYCARNTALSRLGKLKEEQSKIIDFESAVDSGMFMFPSLSTEQVVLQQELQRDIREIVKSLPEREQLLLMGKYVYGESDRELAEWLGCKPSSIRMSLTRARRAALEEILRRRENERPETTAGTV